MGMQLQSEMAEYLVAGGRGQEPCHFGHIVHQLRELALSLHAGCVAHRFL